MEHMEYVYDDGGRAAAGYKGNAGDCVCRAIAIASGHPYHEVYRRLAQGNWTQRKGRRTKKAGRLSARDGIYVRCKWFKDYMRELGATWHPTMQIGSGCQVHLVEGELPMGRLVVSLSRHYTAVINGVIHDNHDPQRSTFWYDGEGKTYRVSERCVYGYWKFA